MSVRWLLAALLAAAWVSGAAAKFCMGGKHPIVILPGIMASQMNASYSGALPGSTPCMGRKKMHQIWPPSATDILPTGFACWKYLIQLEYEERSKTFVNNRGVKVQVESGGRSGTKYHLFQASYSNLTDYLEQAMGYTVGKDLFGAPYDWRLHLSGLEQSGQMDQLMARIENAVNNNCGKKAILIGHSMGGLVSVALLHRDHDWTRQYVKGLVTVSAPFGGTTDQAVTVRMGAVEWNINEWVKNPLAKVAKDLAAHAQDIRNALEEDNFDVATENIAAVAAAYSEDEVLEESEPTYSTTRAHTRRHDHLGGTIDRVMMAKSSKTQAAALPKPINNMVTNYISSAFFKVTMGLPSLAMLLPYPSAYGTWRRIVVTRKRIYTASMMRGLMNDIGDDVTHRAWANVQELDKVLAKGPVPGVASYCMYGHLLDTTLTWSFPDVQENKAALFATPLVTASGDGTVSVQSLKQCHKLTSNVSELGAYGHLEVLKDPATLAHIHKVITEISSIREASHTPSDEARPAAAAAVTTAAAAASDFTPSWPTSGGGGSIVPRLGLLSRDRICIPIPKMSKITQAIQKVFSRGTRRLFAYGMDAPTHTSLPLETVAKVSGQGDTTSGKLQTQLGARDWKRGGAVIA